MDANAPGIGSSALRLALRALCFAVLAAALIAAQIHWRGEIWHERTYWIVALAAFGGFFAVPLSVLGEAIIGWLFPVLRGRVLMGLVFATAFVFSMGLGYVLFQLVLSGEFEPHPDHPLRSIMVAFAQVFVVFLLIGPNYLFPLPLPLLIAAAAFLLAPPRTRG